MTRITRMLAAAFVVALPPVVDASTPRFGAIDVATGVKLHYAETGPADGQPVVFLHGYSDSWFSFSRILPLLPTTYRAFALDLRGHGKSSRPAQGYAPRDLAADVIAFLDAQRIDRAVIVGHSMGSIVAQQVALAAPERVTRLVLVSSVTTIRNVVGVEDIGGAILSFTDPVPDEFIREFQNSTVVRPVPTEFMEQVYAESRRLTARVWQDLLRGMLATDPAVGLGRTGIPTLVLWGERDEGFPRAEQDALVRMIGTASLGTFPGTGHAPHWEQPAEFVAALDAFLRDASK